MICAPIGAEFGIVFAVRVRGGDQRDALRGGEMVQAGDGGQQAFGAGHV